MSHAASSIIRSNCLVDVLESPGLLVFMPLLNEKSLHRSHVRNGSTAKHCLLQAWIISPNNLHHSAHTSSGNPVLLGDLRQRHPRAAVNDDLLPIHIQP